jgi:hypothetical protein
VHVTSRMRSNAPVLFAFVLYAALSFAFVGWRLIHHPGRDLVGYNVPTDSEIFVWSFAWWPHAVATWTNPFVSHAIYAPVGFDLAWATSVPLLAFVFSPITVLFGPAVAYNVAAVVLPAASGCAAFVLCRYLTGSTWASLFGGYLFGFSSFVLGHEYGGDLNLTGAFLVPLMALVLVRYVRSELDWRGLVWRFGLLVGLESWISTEVVLTTALSLLIALPLGVGLLPAYRRRLASMAPPIIGGFAVGVLLAAPLFYYAWAGPSLRGYGLGPAADLLNFVIPTRLIELGGSTFAHFSSGFTPVNDFERNVYIGLPVLAILVLLGLRERRSAGVRFLLVSFVVACTLATGSALYVHGRREVTMPWRIVATLPILDNLETQRFILFGSLASAVAVAWWIATTRGLVFTRPYVLPLLAVASLLPAVTVQWTGHPPRWSFFTDKIYERCIPKGETIAIFPFGRWGDSMLWQAESGFWFTMAEGSMGRDNYPPAFVFDRIVSKLQFQVTNTIALTPGELASFVADHNVGRVVSVRGAGYPDFGDLARLGSVSTVGDALVAPACGGPPLGGRR